MILYLTKNIYCNHQLIVNNKKYVYGITGDYDGRYTSETAIKFLQKTFESVIFDSFSNSFEFSDPADESHFLLCYYNKQIEL